MELYLWWSVEDEERSWSGVWWYSSGYILYPVSLARWQQGEQAAAGVGVVLQYPLASAGTTNDVLGGFIHPLQNSSNTC